MEMARRGGRRGLRVFLQLFSDIFFYLRANQVLVVGWRTWDGSLALRQNEGSKWRQEWG